MLRSADVSQLQIQIQTKNEGVEDDTPSKWQAKESRYNCTQIKQTSSQIWSQETKSLYDNTEINTSRRYSSKGHPYTIISNGQIRQKINKELLELNHDLEKNGLTRHTQSIPPNSKIHILFKSTWNVLQDRLNDRPRN